MQIHHLAAPKQQLQVHSVVQAAYDVLLIGGDLPATGLGAYAIVRDGVILVVSGFGWLHIQQEDVPVLQLPVETPDEQLRTLAWREVAGSLAYMRSSAEARARMLKALGQLCPSEALSLVGLPASRDITALRRQLKLKPSHMLDLERPSVFARAKAWMGH